MTGTELVARSSTDLATAGEWTADRIALAFLAGYSGATRAAYACDLADWATFCRSHGIDGLHAERAHVDLYALDLAETRGLSRSTVARRLAALSGYYGRAVEEEVITRSPVSHVRRPRVSDESVSTGLDKTELRSLIDAARTDGPRELRARLHFGSQWAARLRGVQRSGRGLGYRTRAPRSTDRPQGWQAGPRGTSTDHRRSDRRDARWADHWTDPRDIDWQRTRPDRGGPHDQAPR